MQTSNSSKRTYFTLIFS